MDKFKGLSGPQIGGLKSLYRMLGGTEPITNKKIQDMIFSVKKEYFTKDEGGGLLVHDEEPGGGWEYMQYYIRHHQCDHKFPEDLEGDTLITWENLGPVLQGMVTKATGVCQRCFKEVPK